MAGNMPHFELDDFERALLEKIRSYSASLKTIRQAKKTKAEYEQLKQELSQLMEIERSRLEAANQPASPIDDDLFSNRGHWVYQKHQ